MTEKITVDHPPFSPDSYSGRCAAYFIADQPWENAVDIEERALGFMNRTVTWARRPYRYWLTQTAEQVDEVPATRLRHRMFQVILQSAHYDETDTAELQKWFVMQSNNAPETILHLEHRLGRNETDAAIEARDRDQNFVLNSGLYVPNAHDLARLDDILAMGRLDGYETARR